MGYFFVPTFEENGILCSMWFFFSHFSSIIFRRTGNSQIMGSRNIQGFAVIYEQSCFFSDSLMSNLGN